MPKQAACTYRALHVNIKPTGSEEVEEFAIIKRKTIVLSWVVNQGNWVISPSFHLTNFSRKGHISGSAGYRFRNQNILPTHTHTSKPPNH